MQFKEILISTWVQICFGKYVFPCSFCWFCFSARLGSWKLPFSTVSAHFRVRISNMLFSNVFCDQGSSRVGFRLFRMYLRLVFEIGLGSKSKAAGKNRQAKQTKMAKTQIKHQENKAGKQKFKKIKYMEKNKYNLPYSFATTGKFPFLIRRPKRITKTKSIRKHENEFLKTNST